MEQGNCLDSTLMSARHEARDGSPVEPALDAAVTSLLQVPSQEMAPVEAGTGATQSVSKEHPQADVADLAGACIEQVKRLDAWDAEPGSLTEDEGAAEMERWNALFRRMIDTPSTDLRDLAGKAHLMVADLNRFHPLKHDSSDDARLMRVILAEAMAFGGLGETRPGGSRVRPGDAATDPILPMIKEGRRLLRAYLEAHETIPQDPTTLDPPEEWGAAGRVLWSHVDHVLLKTVPRTAAGCRELARFADEYFEANEVPISDDEMAVLRLIAQSPLLELPVGGADAELLALGREFDALHAEWLLACVASRAAEEKAAALSSDLEQRKGWTAREIYEAALAQPGVFEAMEAGHEMNVRIEKVMTSIRALPARTLDGLAVKARAAIPGIWTSGQYQEDAGLGDDEDWTELNARAVIDECLSLAGVDWKGRHWRPVGTEQAKCATPATSDQPIITPRASAESVALSSLGLNDLCVFYEKLGAARALWGGAMCEPLAEEQRSSQGFVVRTGYGELAEFEDSRAGFLMDRIAGEVSSRSATSNADRNSLLGLRIQHELACEGRILDAGLLSDIAQAWSRTDA